jgi:hypothetical protein
MPPGASHRLRWTKKFYLPAIAHKYRFAVCAVCFLLADGDSFCAGPEKKKHISNDAPSNCMKNQNYPLWEAPGDVARKLIVSYFPVEQENIF